MPCETKFIMSEFKCSVEWHRRYLRQLRQGLVETHAVIEHGAVAYVTSRRFLENMDARHSTRKNRENRIVPERLQC
jgi:hypothetical protein